MRNFNPRSREGSDSASITAIYRAFYFNPRSREGSDTNRFEYYNPNPSFQSTLPRRERLTLGGRGDGEADFNPRSREGSDAGHLGDHAPHKISIHAPAKGATGAG